MQVDLEYSVPWNFHQSVKQGGSSRITIPGIDRRVFDEYLICRLCKFRGADLT